MKDSQTGNLTALPSLTYTYHPQLTLDTLGSYVSGTTYDAAGRIISRLLGSSGLRQDFAYTAWNTQYQGGRLDKLESGTNAPNYDNLQNLDYGYDQVGNILTILDVTNSSQVQCFTYDALDRLTRGATTNDTANGCGSTQLGNGNYDQSYTYDTATGNLSSKAGVSYGYNDTNHEHAVTHLGGVQKYWYDANGNQVTRMVGSDTYTLTYDAENRLVSVSGAVSAAFVYDGDGNRVKSTLSGVTTAFIGNHTEWEVSTSSLTRYYYAGNTRVAMRKNNVVYYLLSDHLGSTSVTTDQNGQNPVKQYYLPWGEVRYSSGSLQTNYTYTGQYSNVSDFGLMYYNARWYDSTLGRFTSADTVVPQPGNPQGWDRYAYTRNNPINYTDPSGHRPVEGCGDEGKEACTPTQQELAAYAYFIQQNETSLCKGGNMNYCSPLEEGVYNNRPMTGFHVGYSGQGGFGIEGGVYYQKEWVIDWIKGDVYTTKTVGVFGYGGTPTGISGQVNAGISNIHGIPWWFSEDDIKLNLSGSQIDTGVALGVESIAVLDVGFSRSNDIDEKGDHVFRNGYQMYSTSHDLIFGIDTFPNLFDGSFQMGKSSTFTANEVEHLW